MSTEENSKSEVLESWEEIDEIQLDSTVNRLKEETMKSRIEEERLSATASSSVHVVQKPVVILRRPQTSNGTSENSGQSGNGKPKTQIKSLHQRQQEYAEARMRILGSMPHEDGETSLTIGMNGTRPSNADGNGLILRR